MRIYIYTYIYTHTYTEKERERDFVLNPYRNAFCDCNNFTTDTRK